MQNSWHIEHEIEIAAPPAAVWAKFADLASWTTWNAGIESIELEGAFATGTWFTTKPPGQEAFRSRLIDVRENVGFTDETAVGELVVVVKHRLEQIDNHKTRVVYALEARGPEASEIGPAIASDFPDVLAALKRTVEAR